MHLDCICELKSQVCGEGSSVRDPGGQLSWMFLVQGWKCFTARWMSAVQSICMLESPSPSQHSKSWPESLPPIYMHAGHSLTWETSKKLSFLPIVSLRTFWRPHYTLPRLYTACILLSFWALVLLIYSLATSPSPPGQSQGHAEKQIQCCVQLWIIC